MISIPCLLISSILLTQPLRAQEDTLSAVDTTRGPSRTVSTTSSVSDQGITRDVTAMKFSNGTINIGKIYDPTIPKF